MTYIELQETDLSTTVPTSIPSTGTWKIDSVHSSATFKVIHHVVATFRGHFHEVSGALEDGVLSGSVQTDSIDLGTLPLLKEHLFALTGSTSRTTRP